MGMSIDEIKEVFRQYVLVKGNDVVNEALIDRVANVILREFEVQPLTRFTLAGGPIDLSTLSASTENVQEVTAAAPNKPRGLITGGSSSTADVAASPEKTSRPAKTIEEQIQDVEAERKRPSPPVPTVEEREKRKLLEGQRALPTSQQSYFHDVISKVTAKQADTPRKTGGVRDLADLDEDADGIEVSEGDTNADTDIEQIVDIADTDLDGLFGESETGLLNPKVAMDLQKALPKKLDSVSETTHGKNRSISRIS